MPFGYGTRRAINNFRKISLLIVGENRALLRRHINVLGQGEILLRRTTYACRMAPPLGGASFMVLQLLFG